MGYRLPRGVVVRAFVPHFFLLSAETVERSVADNATMTRALEERLASKGLPFKRMEGREAGGPLERSFLVLDSSLPQDNETNDIVRGLALYFDQESYIERHRDGYCEQHFTDDRETVSLGHFEYGDPEVDEGYTRDPNTGETWVIR